MNIYLSLQLPLLLMLMLGRALPAQFQPLTLQFSSASARSGDEVCLSLEGNGVRGLASMQFSVIWDAEVLEFVRVGEFGLPAIGNDNFGLNRTAEGALTFLWVAPFDQAPPARARLFELCFRVKGPAGACSPVSFASQPTSLEFIGEISNQFSELNNYALVGGMVVAEAENAPAPLRLELERPRLAVCVEGAPARIVAPAVGGAPPYEYEWTLPNGEQRADTVLETTTPGRYRLRVRDGGCGEVQSIFGVLRSDLTITSSQVVDAACEGAADGTASIAVGRGVGRYSFKWSNDAETAAVSGLDPGSYTVTVTDEGGCSLARRLEVGRADSLNWQAVVAPPTCGEANGAIRIEIPDGAEYTFEWSNGARGENLEQIGPGIYTLRIADGEGCEARDTFDLSWTPLSAISTYRCRIGQAGEIITLAAASVGGGRGPYHFAWSNGREETQAQTSSVSVPGAGVYRATITDSDACSLELMVETPTCGLDNEPRLRLAAGSGEVQAGELICLDIALDSAAQVAGLQFSLRWDPSALRFMGHGDTGALAFDVVPGQGEGTVGFVRSAPLTPVAFADGGVLLRVCFLAVGDQRSTPVAINDRPLAFLAFDGAGELYGLQARAGEVRISGSLPPVDVRVGKGSVERGQVICVPVSARGFKDIDSLRFRLRWDASLLLFDSLAAGALPGIGGGNIATPPAPGRLDLRWAAPGDTGATVSDETTLFELCFQALDSLGLSELAFDRAPMAALARNSAGVPLPLLFRDGFLAVTDGELWPGDTNLDGQVDHHDLLPIGLAYGAEGPARAEASLEWLAQSPPVWSQATPRSEVNFAYIDADGDGRVTAADTLAIARNWGRLAGREEGVAPRSGEDWTLAVDAYDANAGEAVVYDIALKRLEAPLEAGVYGLAFSVTYDAGAVLPESVKVDFTDAWLGENILHIYRHDAEASRIDLALTRIDGEDVFGEGLAARLSLRYGDPFTGAEPTYQASFRVEGARLIAANEDSRGVSVQTTFATLGRAASTRRALPAEWVRVFPNPAREALFLDVGNLSVSRLELLGLDGRALGVWPWSPRLSLQGLEVGMYLLRLVCAEGVVVKRVTVAR
jgi:hypothetical protein